MNAGSGGKGRGSDTTLDNAAPSSLPSTLSESQVLALEATDAQTAMSNTLRSIGANLGQAANPVKLARRHPAAIIGAAAAVGFVTIRILERPRKPRAPKPPRPEVASDNHRLNGEAPKRPRRGKLSRVLMKTAFNMLRPAITGFVMAQIKPAAPPAREPQPDTLDLSDAVDEPVA